MRETSGPHVVRFRLWWYRLVGAGFYAFVIVLCIASEIAHVWLVSLPLAVGATVMLGLCLRGATVEMRPDDLVIRGLRTRRIPWSSIERVGVTRGGSVYMIPWRVPAFVLKDGRVVRADELRSLRTPSVVDDLVAEAKKFL